jgi:N-acetylneuraminic acid mutarotase
MATARKTFALCGLGGELYASGGLDAYTGTYPLASVERYNPSLDSWSAASPMPRARFGHCVASVGDIKYVIGGIERIDGRF